MRFVLLSYGDEDTPGPVGATDVGGWALGFLPSSTSMTWRQGRALDGPVSAGRTQLLGLEIVDCESLDTALGLAAKAAERDTRVRGVEVRPLSEAFLPTET